MTPTKCKLVHRVHVKDGDTITGSVLGVWSDFNKASQYAKKATLEYQATHPNLAAVVVDGVELLTFKTM